ncbi:transglycosylase SLT domain-containing protein [Propionivibrio sp.]|uniref:transglycosylase SLT domain-containing protein n=1 Tax=Propionivibrio sp. TaxID=2212460 RepID=UPI0026255D45|nr:transglycosylase SLT domain-containing protein [Propionivibrio sp.]
MITALFIVLGIINIFFGSTQPVEIPESTMTDLSVSVESHESTPADEPEPLILSPRMQGALDYVIRRYRVSPEALVPVFEEAQLIGKERRIDPLLIVAIIGIESGFDQFAESSMGARGLMQVIPRFHRDKVPDGAGDGAFLDPRINIRVGVYVLEEAIRRRGGLVAGLQYYAGSSEPEGIYASKVLAEKERLEQAARRSAAA